MGGLDTGIRLVSPECECNWFGLAFAFMSVFLLQN